MAIAQLQRGELGTGLHSIDLLALDGEPARLIAARRGRRREVVIDAGCAGADPGTIHRLQIGIDPLPPWVGAPNSHSAGLAEAIDLARTLDALPESLVVFGVEPEDLSQGEGLSPSVQLALPALVELVVGAARFSTQRIGSTVSDRGPMT